jgi:hypothetical protein
MMAVPSVTQGRGAFSRVGKDNGSRYYEYIVGKPLDGASPTKDENYQAVNYGVKAIQRRINAYGYSPALIEDGKLGRMSGDGIKWVQKKLGLTDDGQAGPATCRALWRDLLIWFGGVHHVPASQLYGFMMLESVGDPGALGYTTPSDRGLNQINEKAHPDITDDQAFDPVFSLDYTAKRLQDARIKYSGKSVELKNYCAIAQHNSPLWANQWYANGTPPNDQIKKYVDLVLGHALNFR